MSGLDEQVEKIKLPKCLCGKIPYGYTMGKNKNPYVWLTIKDSSFGNEHPLKVGGRVTLSEIKECDYVFCYECNSFYSKAVASYQGLFNSIQKIVIDFHNRGAINK